MEETQTFGHGATTEVQLYVPSSKIKGEVQRMGAYPFGQQWFMTFYLLAKNKLLTLLVTTEEELKSCCVEVKKDVTPDASMNIQGTCCETNEEIENFITQFKCPDIQPKTVDDMYLGDPKGKKRDILPLSLYKNFNHFLANNTSAALESTLGKLDTFFKENGTKFAFSDNMTYADCVLMPRLHHVRVAAKELRDYEIPKSMKHLWRYMRDAYKEEAFNLSCPSDQDIIIHYQEKVGSSYRGHATIQATTFSCAIPEGILDHECGAPTAHHDSLKENGDQQNKHEEDEGIIDGGTGE